MQSLAADFLDTQMALADVLAPLSGADYTRATAFKGWTLNDVLAHLHTWNHAAALSLEGDEAFKSWMKQAGKTIRADGMRAFEAGVSDGKTGPALRDHWDQFARQMAARFANTDAKARLAWVGPSMSARSSLTARLMETWAHGQEVFDELGLERQNTDALKNIVILGVNTYGWTYKNNGLDLPGPMPFLSLTAPSGAVWTYGEDSADNRIDGKASEFCQVVTQVRNIADTTLTLSGPIARDWMSKAQCFAGPPEPPPAPGTRKRRN